MVDPFLFLMKDVHDCHLPSSESYLSDKTDQNEKCVAKVVLRRVSTPFVFHIHDFTFFIFMAIYVVASSHTGLPVTEQHGNTTTTTTKHFSPKQVGVG
jgi:hypothetical protein